MILAQTRTDQDADDPSQVAPLLDPIEGRGIAVVIRPRATAAPAGEPGSPTQRDRHLKIITERGRLALQPATKYGQRSLVKTTMGRYKALIGSRLRACGVAAQQIEAALAWRS